VAPVRTLRAVIVVKPDHRDIFLAYEDDAGFCALLSEHGDESSAEWSLGRVRRWVRLEQIRERQDRPRLDGVADCLDAEGRGLGREEILIARQRIVPERIYTNAR